ncbi:IS5 family transposase [Methylobacterium nodulans]|uniref:Transposase n=1 Tax=Methylobacterium nodulans (strain LMG 21967 / CNCM I-2342 / ORS 2060) TaxID=460265 RepID=B8II47_METNO|nr:IS5 family transposase [Methylobacterium nodulans]ACL57916.1 transposase [Methylobacterium nodulans ORS 2060]
MRPVAHLPSGSRPDQVHELSPAIQPLDQLPSVPLWVAVDRGYTSYRFRLHLWRLEARAAIPPQHHEAPVACLRRIDINSSRVDRLWARLKERRAMATRYEKTASSFLRVICLTATIDWLK